MLGLTTPEAAVGLPHVQLRSQGLSRIDNPFLLSTTMAHLLLANTGLAAAAPATLADALARVAARLDAWASNSSAYHSLLVEVFAAAGTDPGLWQQAADALQATLQSSGLAIGLERLSNAELPGINGAYTAQAPGGGERIYLNAAWLQDSSAAQIEAVLLEEIGHAFDSRLNGTADSAGDEGERFSALLRDQQPTAASFSENDHHQLILADFVLAIEAAGDTTPPVAITTNPAFASAATNPFRLVTVGSLASPSLVDIERDGDLDVFIGISNGTTLFFRNTAAAGSTTPVYAAVATNPFGLVSVGFFVSPSLVDIDRDGDLDAFIGNQDGNTLFFRNSAPSGSSNPAYTTTTTQRILYNTATGLLAYDSDGNGASASIAFATLTPGLALTSSQFIVT